MLDDTPPPPPTTHSPRQREFCAAEASMEFARGLVGQRIQFFTGLIAGSVIKVLGVSFPRGELEATYRLRGRMENLLPGAHPGACEVIVTSDMRVRILGDSEIPATENELDPERP